MLAEWFTHLTTPCQKPYRQLGYLGELIAIKHRYRRCKTAWQPHLESCKKLISEASENTPQTGSAVVLGSGQLLDIPIDALARRFKTVYLVDICHLKNSRQIAKKYDNIELVETDISGTVTSLMNWEPGDALPDPDPVIDVLPAADYVVTSNLLAQLPLAPLHYLEKRAPDLPTLERDGYARLILAHHLTLLQNLECPVTLISEIRHIVSNGDQILEKSDPLYGQFLPTSDREWWWELAPRPELSPDYDLKLRVAGIFDLNNANYERTCRNTTLAAP